MKIKVLKDTPFNKKGEVITDVEFFINYPKLNITNNQILGIKNDAFKFFKIVNETKFKVGDWVFNNHINKALLVVDSDVNWYPCICSIDVVDEHSSTYLRYATKREIAYSKLIEMPDHKDILIGLEKIWYFNNIWVEVKEAWGALTDYKTRCLFYNRKVYTGDKEFLVKYTGLKIGCKVFNDFDIKFMFDIREQLLSDSHDEN